VGFFIGKVLMNENWKPAALAREATEAAERIARMKAEGGSLMIGQSTGALPRSRVGLPSIPPPLTKPEANRKQSGSIPEAFWKQNGSAPEARNSLFLEENQQFSFRSKKISRGAI
jgi:hypothetical protein